MFAVLPNRYVDVAALQFGLTHLCEWVHNYIQETAGEKMEASHHTVFHCVCQAVFYVFCFRLEDILMAGDGIIYLQSLRLDAIVKCRYLPLQVSVAEHTHPPGASLLHTSAHLEGL